MSASPANSSGPDAALAARFAAAIQALGPFEARPTIAVALSGGVDSVALTLLLRDWLAACDGRLVALTVDHGLRAESAAEAAAVAAWCAAQNMPHQLLRWEGEKPATALQEAARDARYGLISAWCRMQGVLHVALAHHADDQAETMALRAARKSGPDGLAAMAALREWQGVRWLRPLLALPKATLRDFVARRAAPWWEDASNHHPRFARAQLRQARVNFTDMYDPALIAHSAQAMHAATARAVREEALAKDLAVMARIFQEGYARLAPEALAHPYAELMLYRVLTTISGSIYPPRSAVMDGLLTRLRAQPERVHSVHGCLVQPWRGSYVVAREPARVGPPVRISGVPVYWDRRFHITHAAPLGVKPKGFAVRALGRAGIAHLRALKPAPAALKRLHMLPDAVRQTLPALWHLETVLAVPHIGYRAAYADGEGAIGEETEFSAVFSPANPLAGAPFYASIQPL